MKINSIKDQYRKCIPCNTMIPLDMATTNTKELQITMPYGKDIIPTVEYRCPMCNNWLFSSVVDSKRKAYMEKPMPPVTDIKVSQEPVMPEIGKAPIKSNVDVDKYKDDIDNTMDRANEIVNNVDSKELDKKPKGTVIVIEGTDGSGKRTQAEMLLNRLIKMGVKASLYSFPNYESIQGQVVKRYLNGEFKGQPIENCWNEWFRNALLYTNDRLVTCMEKGEDGRSILEKYNDGEVIIFDRYTQSNFIHQGCHIDDIEDLKDFIYYFTDLEYMTLGLPEPDKVIYLRVSPEMCIQNIVKRGNEKDIHENLESLKKANKHTDFLIEFLEWDSIQCSDGLTSVDTGNSAYYMHSKDHISREVFSRVQEVLVDNNQTGEIRYCTTCLNEGMYNEIKHAGIVNNPELKIGVCPTCQTLYDIERL